MGTVSVIGKGKADCAALTARVAAVESELTRIRRELEALSRSAASTPRVADLKAATLRISAETRALTTALDQAAPSPAATVTSLAPIPLALLKLQSQQLTLIKGIDTAAARQLNELGIHEFADIAALMPEDVAEIGRKLGNARRIAKECWIEQAAILAGGQETAHARRIRAGELACVVQAPASAQVIDLAARRQRRAGFNATSIGAKIRAAGFAAAAAAAMIVALNGSGLGQQFLSGLGFKPACASTLPGLWTGCTLAALP